ncbi:MAG: ribosomal RNA small subunit methyltransferase A [Chloroflexi bacterium]|nr:ribosomal RNA small subunit methyltransferase A [Chloroflexota bacterium]
MPSRRSGRRHPAAGAPGRRPHPARSRKALAQHFLKDPTVARRIVDALQIRPEDVIVEIGPGRAALTGRLAEKASCLCLVEIDETLAERLSEKFAGTPAVRVIVADARSFDPESVEEIRDNPYKVVGNLPYYAASPIVRHFLELSRPPTLMVVMVQREVANGMAAAPGDMSLLSIGVQVYAEPKILMHVPPRAFSPPPKVHSAVIALKPRDQPAIEVDRIDDFFALARAGFTAPRKTIVNSLAIGLQMRVSDLAPIIGETAIETTRRPATTSIAEWESLYRAWAAASKPGLASVRQAPAVNRGRRE